VAIGAEQQIPFGMTNEENQDNAKRRARLVRDKSRGRGERNLREVPEEIEGALAVAEVWCATDGFGDEVLGTADSLDRGIAEDEETEERGGEGAASSVGRGGLDVFADEAVDFACG
jgi:hypothetical protein